MPFLPVSVLLLIVGCEGWPVYAHLPEDTVERVEVGAVGPGEDTVTWIHLDAPLEDGSDDDPRGLAAEDLAIATGNYVAGRITGSGWDPTQTEVERWEECGDVAQFPPFDNGNYLGDADWRVIDVQAAGTLCSFLKFTQPGPQADVLVYPVNSCNLPTQPLVYGTGEPVGYNVAGQVNTWSYPLLAPTRLALVAAAWAPNDPTAEWNYNWGIALLPPPDAGSTEEIVCPTPPAGTGR